MSEPTGDSAITYAPGFVSKLWPIAKDEWLRSTISPLITITQAAHESSWGTSGLTKKANNLYGFTGERWETAGKAIIKLATKEFVKGQFITVLRPFRAYTSWAESVRDWANLMHIPIYRFALTAAIEGNLAGFAKEVKKAGYATDPNYDTELVSVGNAILGMFPDINDVPL